MKIIEIDLNYMADEDSVIALGNFDGVHKGHMELINRAVKNAKTLNIKSSLLLFNEHTCLLYTSDAADDSPPV